VTVVAVAPVSVPSPVTVDQFTPEPETGSLFTVAVTSCVFPWSRVTGPVGDNVTVMAGLIVMLREPVVAVNPRESVTLTVKVKVPAAVGGPALINPVDAPRVRGPGNAPEATVKEYPVPEPPLAVNAGAT
jgi:hypothetical protein